ncbi:uncharacterized protein L203_101127 [Cryptococcus depauperatus CBS 7841]|uniref:Uncharacterized protein n=1 Tax=Cryptococcus depauperatus CBS 7841 TaxID=1295531 RepID=A0A1E3IKF5_9TREE|nr:hypothetical protein L203_02404 [Cryptococcus depauperatus CBS 7841]
MNVTRPEETLSRWGTLRTTVRFSVAAKEKNRTSQADTLAISSASSSAGAAFARSLVLFTGFLFKKPSKLFKPNRVDNWLGLRQLALSTDQTLSPQFIRSLLSNKSGLITVTLVITPPMLVNATLGFLLFTSHSIFSLALAKLSIFQRKLETDQGEVTKEDEINLETLIRGPTVIPNHPTFLSGIAGAGAGVVQGLAFTPVENVMRFVQQSTMSWATLLARFVNLPVSNFPSAFSSVQPITPFQAVKNLFASKTWKKEKNWWKGWKWAAARDAFGYSCFFAAFDVTRRVGLRVKQFYGGDIQQEWINLGDSQCSPKTRTIAYRPCLDRPQAPVKARLAQAVTIVTGGILASVLAQIIGRPFRICQRIMMLDEFQRIKVRNLQAQMQSQTQPQSISTFPEALHNRHSHPILDVYRQKGLRPFIQSSAQIQSAQMEKELTKEKLSRALRRIGWRVASVGPWGLGFLVWAWVGGEV